MIPKVLAGAVLAITLLGACHKTSSEADAPAGEATSGSVLVQTAMPARDSLPETLVLYGEVAQDVGGSENVSFARPVLISKLLVSAGQPVRRGQALLEVITDPNAATSYLQAQSAVEAATRDFKAQEELATERLTTQSQVGAARKALSDAQAALSAQRLLGAAPGAQMMHATRDGVVVNLSAQQGDRVPAGTSVLQLAKAGGKRALLGAEPEDVSRIAPGMAVKLSPVFGGVAVVASIAQVYGVINPQTRLVDIVAGIPETSSELIPGMKVRGEITLSAADLWTLPRSAVLEDADGSYVFQIANQHAKRIKVRVQIENGELSGVAGALDPKLPVVIVGNYELSDGAQVRVAAAQECASAPGTNCAAASPQP